MKKITFVILLLSIWILPSVNLAQEDAESERVENWIQKMTESGEDTELQQYYKLYSREDVAAAREKLALLTTEKSKNSWSNYGDDSGVNITKLYWSESHGFVDFTLYTCFVELRALNYGTVVNAAGYLQFDYHYSANSPSRKKKLQKFIKVRWDERNFLVAERSLKMFLRHIAGLNNVRDETFSFSDGWGQNDVWSQADKSQDKAGETPILPVSYRHLLVRPIKTTIVSLAKSRIEQKKDEYGKIILEQKIVPVVINAGANKNVKVGMQFYVRELDDWIEVKRVYANKSIAELSRYVEDGKARCDKSLSDENYVCRELSKKMKAVTRPY